MNLIAFLIAFLSSVFSLAHASLNVQEVISPKGIKAWLVEDHRTPVIAMIFSFEAGTAFDPEDKVGLADLTAQMLGEGAGDYNAHDYAQKLQDIASYISFNANLTHFQGSIKTTKDNAQQAFNLLKITLTKPHFSSDEFNKIVNAHITGLANLEKKPATIATLRLREQLFGPNHPYARLQEGTIKTVKNIKVADLKDFMRHLSRATLRIGVCGNISAQELKSVLDEIFSFLPANIPLPQLPHIKLPQISKTTIVKVEQPQSIGLFAQQAIPFNHPDYLKLSLLNEALGYGSVSRLMEEVREKRGYAYHIGTTIEQTPFISLLMGSVGSQNSRIMKSLSLIKDEWKRIRDHGLTQQEFQDAKSHILGAYTLNFTSSPQISDLLLIYQEIGAPIDYMQKREHLINTITLEQVNHFAKQFFKPDELQIVVVGKPEEGEAHVQ